jgi:DNA-binding Xre family transcriptional regulator
MDHILGIPNLLCQGIPNFSHVRLANMKTWHERFTLAIEQTNLRPTDIAKAIGVSNATVSDWESGETKKIEGENLLKVCDLLKINPKWLLFGKGAMSSELNIEDKKLKHILMIAQDLPEYGKDKAIKELTDITELIRQAQAHQGQ